MSQGIVRVRHATSADAALLADLATRTFVESFGPQNRPEDMQDYAERAFNRRQIETELRDAHATFLLAFDAATEVGYAKLRRGTAPECVTGRRPIELQRLYVDGRWLSRGVGARLMTEALEEARRRGHDCVWLGVWERNQRALAFYRRHGFAAVGGKEFQLGGDRQNDLVMQRLLA